MIEVTGHKTKLKYYIPFNMIASMDHDEVKGYTIIYMSKNFTGKSNKFQVIESGLEILSMGDSQEACDGWK